MNGTAVLADLYDRIPPLVDDAARDLDAAQLAHRPDAGANPISAAPAPTSRGWPTPTSTTSSTSGGRRRSPAASAS